MNQISVPDCWEELTDYQQREIIHIISHTDTEDFTEQYMQIVQILLLQLLNLFPKNQNCIISQKSKAW